MSRGPNANSPMSVSIRDAAAIDAGSIAGLMSQLGYPTLEAEMRERLARVGADSNYRTLVAEIGTRVVGIVGVGLAPFYERNGTYCRLLVLAVDDQYRRQGIGRVLVRAAEDWAMEHGAAVMLVNTSHRRHDAHRFYERTGYDSTGLRFVKALQSAT
jgi:GNAT superfamily N-acetyltransferase